MLFFLSGTLNKISTKTNPNSNFFYFFPNSKPVTKSYILGHFKLFFRITTSKVLTVGKFATLHSSR